MTRPEEPLPSPHDAPLGVSPARSRATARAAGSTRRRALQVAAAVAGASLVLAGCSGDPAPKARAGIEVTAEPSDEPTSDPRDKPRPDEDIPDDLKRFYEQDVAWEDCGSFECADVMVPLDWENPSHGSVTLAAKRHLSDNDPMGTVLVNPGGPGGSGVQLVTYAPLVFGESLVDNYDILGFDPRGVGGSSPVVCLTDEEKDEINAKSYPLDDAGLAEMEADATEVAEKCFANTGAFLGEVDTQSAARDMDVLRYVVGDPQLNYLGFSYGTQLGGTYAGLYPEKVGKMVLDGAIDLRLTTHEQSLQQAVGFENALRAFVTDCQTQDDCPVTGTVDEGMAQIKALLDGLLDTPLPTDDPDGRELTQTGGFYAVAQPLYAQELWGTLRSALTSAFAGDGSELLDSADSYHSREDDGTYSDNQGEAFRAINCLDGRGSSDRATMDAELAEIVAAAPTMGSFFAYGGLGCKNWPFPAVDQAFDISAPGAAPIVVIGTTNDPATPYVWAEGLAEHLESGVLVTYEGEGHTAYGRSNSCIIDAVDGYFVDDVVPDDGLTC